MKSVVFAALVVFSGSPSFAQAVSAAGGKPLPPGFVDGSKNPDRIPDSAAYRLVFLDLKVPEAPDQKALARRNVSIGVIGLSNADATILKEHLAAFSAKYRAWEDQAASASGAAATSANAEAVALVLETRDALIKQLTPAGAARLVAYVQNAKSRMIVRP